MTTKPKAKKFRIRRSPAAAAPAEATPAQAPRQAPRTGPGTAAQAQPGPDYMRGPETAPAGQTAATGDVASARQVTTEEAIDAIRREGLTGRQLRMARRVAQKHGLPATSDFDAVRLLRAQGIDPFKQSNMLELVVNEAGRVPAQPPAPPGTPATAPDATPPATGRGQTPGRIQLPQTMPAGQANLPSTETGATKSPADRRAMEIMAIQRDIARRRRKKMVLLLTRLAFFVFLPTLMAGWYFYVVATPMYATKSEFLILKNESSGSAVSGLFSGTQFATNQDAIAVQSYLESKDAMLRLDHDQGYKAHFSQDWIDPIQRLSPNPSNEEAYKLYKRNTTIGYDPTEGVIRMEVSAADPLVSAQFSAELIRYAEERVDNLSRRMRENSVADSERTLAEAQAERRAAQSRLVRLQQEGAVLDPEGRIAALRSQITQYEVELQNKQLALQALLDNRRPNQAKVEGAQGDVRRLENLLAQLNAEMTQAAQGENSLAQLAANIQLAQSDLANADMMLQASMDQLQSARREAMSQARYLTTSVKPVPSDDPSYPRKFENTILAFMVFAGVYLMISLTASILREQVSS